MTFNELLDEHEDTLLNLKKDVTVLVAFEEIVLEKTKGKPCAIRTI